MLPQKKNLLRRNAWYRQQLLQQALTGTTYMMNPDHSYPISNVNGMSASTASKSPAQTESSIVC